MKIGMDSEERSYLEAHKVWVDQHLRAEVIKKYCESGPGGGYSHDYGKVRVSQVLNGKLNLDTIFQIFMVEIEKKKEEFLQSYKRNRKLDKKIIEKLMTLRKIKFENGQIVINGLITISRKDLLVHRSRISQAEHAIPTEGVKNFHDLHPDVQAEIKRFVSDALDPKPALMMQRIG